MGWLKSLFRKKEAELQKAYVEAEQLQQWFDSKTEFLIENIKESIKEDLNSINDNISQIKKASNVLEEAKLRNERIPERAIHIMEGNRRSYINAVLNFVDKIQTPSAINFTSVSDFVSAFEDSLSQFTKSSAKNFHVLQEFFAHESGGIAKRIKDIDLTIRGLMDNDYRKINSVMENISKVNELLKKKETAEIMLSEQEKERFEIMQQIDAVKESLEGLKKSKDYKFFKEAEKKKDEIAKHIKDAEKRLFELFAPLDRPMRKFAKIAAEGEDTLKSYSKSPLKALLDDRELRIVGLMAKMKSAIEKGEIELKEKAKEKALKQIEAVKEDMLKKTVQEHNSLNELYAEKERSLKMNLVVQKQSEAEYKLSHLKDKLAKLEQNIMKLNKFVEVPEIDGALHAIKKDVRDVLNTELRIKMGNRMVGKEAAGQKEAPE